MTAAVPPRPVSLSEVSASCRRGGAVRMLLTPVTVGATAGLFGEVSLEPGEWVTEHYHPYSEECVYVVRGNLVMHVEGHPVPLCEQQSLMVPIAARHRLENVGAHTAQVIFHLGPLAPAPHLGHVDTEEPGPGLEPSPADIAPL
jgi:putative monooxygenase